LKDAVTGVRDDLNATNIDKVGHVGKWNVRYPNGDRPANEADCTFMAKARQIVLALMGKIEEQTTAAASIAKVVAEETAARDTLIGELRTQIETLTKDAANRNLQHEGELDDLHKDYDGQIANLRAEIEALKTPKVEEPKAELDTMGVTAEPGPVEAEAPTHLAEAPKANLKPKRKRMTKAEAAVILDIAPLPETTAPVEG